jgi:osmotically-inducible protein OsmY
MQRMRSFVVPAVALVAVGCTQVTGRSASTAAEDAKITAKVKTKLASQQIGPLTRVDVDTVRGTVYLTGIVEKAAMKTRASEWARSVEGMTEVVNNLKVPSSAG